MLEVTGTFVLLFASTERVVDQVNEGDSIFVRGGIFFSKSKNDYLAGIMTGVYFSGTRAGRIVPSNPDKSLLLVYFRIGCKRGRLQWDEFSERTL